MLRTGLLAALVLMESGGEKPRALVLSTDDRAVIVNRLARAVLRFQDDFLSRETSPTGLLCQVWLPDVVEDNQIVLKTKGMPFCVAGMGDLLALFRCISCRFAFGTNVQRPNTLGAPGRVFTSSEPEMCCNVQQYAKGAYLRKAEAEQCQVQSTLLLPLFISPRRNGCVGVLEVVQTSEDMAFVDVAGLIATALERCELYTCGMEAVRRQTPLAVKVTHAMLLPAQTGLLLPPPSDNDSGPQGSGDGAGMAGGDGHGGQHTGNGGSGSGGMAGDSDEFSGGDDDDDDDDDDFGDGRRRGGPGTSRGGVNAKSKRRGTGNPGKPGVRLTLADLQSQFGVGLKEAASRLGICPTTLKRACRRHGIQRWPRRQLQKVNRALDEMEARDMMQPQQHLAAATAPAAAGAIDPFGAGGGFPTSDNRWMTLSQLIPAYHSGLLGYNDQQQVVNLSQQQQQQGPQQQQQQQQLFLMQHHHQQQQQYLQQQALAVVAAAAGRQASSAPASQLSLPDGVLAMGSTSMHRNAPAMQEVSAVSGVSTMGQPPPQAPRRSFDSIMQRQQQQQHPAATTAAAHQQARPQMSGGSSGGAPLAAQYLQRMAAANYVLPFGAAAAVAPVGGAGTQPVVRLPDTFMAAGAPRSLSSLSVPCVGGDLMPSLGRSPPDDEQVGFLDSTVLELLLNEERGNAWRQHAFSSVATAAAAAGGSDPAGSAPASSAGELLPSLSLPGGGGNGGYSSAAYNNLSFMM